MHVRALLEMLFKSRGAAGPVSSRDDQSSLSSDLVDSPLCRGVVQALLVS